MHKNDRPRTAIRMAWRPLLGLAVAVALLTPAPQETASAQSDTATAAAGDEAVAPPEPVPTQAKNRGPNSFNRLMKKNGAKVNAPPAEDGIHDPTNPGTSLLQWPAEAFEALPKSPTGNMVDWVEAYQKGLIQPRHDVEDPTVEAMVMDLDIVREVKGSMPDVVYPHKAHTEWLDCTNCHDEIFIPEKGKNQISMAAILLGQKCGVCHGKVAFPVSDCRRCHSKPKTPEQLRDLAKQ